jgi:hypothetical protein
LLIFFILAASLITPCGNLPHSRGALQSITHSYLVKANIEGVSEDSQRLFGEGFGAARNLDETGVGRGVETLSPREKMLGPERVLSRMVKNSPIFSLTHPRTTFFGRNSEF